jgi:Protein of unknown function (DUF1826)
MDGGKAMNDRGMATTAGAAAAPGTDSELLRALSAVASPECEAVWVDRPADRALERYLDAMARTTPLPGRWLTQWEIGDALALDGWPVVPGRDIFEADLTRLAGTLCLLFGCRQAKIRIEVTTQTTCPRFHVDNVAARLLCTYRGPGTEYLEGRCADRSRLGPGNGGMSDEASGLIRDAQGIHHIPAFSVAILKGERWPGNASRGAIHRSPAVPAGSGPRVMAAIDTI